MNRKKEGQREEHVLSCRRVMPVGGTAGISNRLKECGGQVQPGRHDLDSCAPLMPGTALGPGDTMSHEVQPLLSRSTFH